MIIMFSIENDRNEVYDFYIWLHKVATSSSKQNVVL